MEPVARSPPTTSVVAQLPVATCIGRQRAFLRVMRNSVDMALMKVGEPKVDIFSSFFSTATAPTNLVVTSDLLFSVTVIGWNVSVVEGPDGVAATGEPLLPVGALICMV